MRVVSFSSPCYNVQALQFLQSQRDEAKKLLVYYMCNLCSSNFGRQLLLADHQHIFFFHVCGAEKSLICSNLLVCMYSN